MLVTANGASNAADLVDVTWEKTLQDAAFVREGMDRYRHPQYQYECLGLGGTVMRVGPDGLTRTSAVRIRSNGYLKHFPYLSYQYWWDEEGHRHLPFDLQGGYGEKMEPMEVSTFRHRLDITTGLLEVDLGLQGDGKGSKLFQSHRELFVTPEGILVIRVADTSSPSKPFRMGVGINQDVRIYLNGGVYAKAHEPWTGEGEGKKDGLVILAKRPKSCTAALGIAVEGGETVVDPKLLELGSKSRSEMVTFYIAPASSYEGDDPASVAWKKAEVAKSRGYQVLRQETAQWWKEYYKRSAVSLPDADLQKWFARSTYYMGVFFGNTDIPPGCNGTSIESFAGAICPEYDLVLNQMALLYGNHFKEARRVVGWLERVLPRAEKYAKEGLTLHQTSVNYTGGAKFGPLMGYDGTILLPPTTGEGIWAHEDFSGNNAALMALNYVDWSGDESCEGSAKKILRETTEISVQDLQWRDDFQSYLNKNMPATVQQAGTLYALRESARRGVGETDWTEKADKILMPTAEYKGRKLFSVGPGGILAEYSGDCTWLSPVWYYRVVADEDPIVKDSYDLFRTSKTGNYTFNNGWMGVIAAKLRDGKEAVRWAKNFLQPGVILFDDTCFGELVSDFEDFKKTPEVAAHAAFICNLTQMLLGPDDEKELTVFPAIPIDWEKEGVSFQGLACKGNLLASGEFSSDLVQVKIENRSSQSCVRNLRVRLPEGTTRVRESEDGLKIENGWALLSDVKVPAKEIRTFCFTVSQGTSSTK